VEFTNGAHDNRVGGSKFAERNVISGNDNGGVGIYSGSFNNLLYGNYIGTNASGNAALANAKAGVIATDHAGMNFIGGPGVGNVISGNNQGVVITSGVAGSIVQGNKIGTDASGLNKIGNATDGVFVFNSGNQIGGRNRGTGNLISGNGGDGIRVNGSSGNLIARNVIGADGTANKAMGNAKNGILMMTTNTSLVRDNIVAFNGGTGVQVATGTDNAIVSNSIYANADMQINLGWDGVSKNDGTDADAGANGLQNTPTLTSAARSATATTIAGSITSTPKTAIYIEVFAGGGKSLVGALSVTTNASGVVSFSLVAPLLPAGTLLVATATSPTGCTSEFSSALAVK
jgi:parallel beta-helix repeat protein